MVDEELGRGEFVMRDAVPTSDVIRIRFGDVDGLRAIAILAVCAAAILRLTTHGLSPVLAGVASIGSQGLALFLVLSGFTLAFPVMAVLRQDGRTYIDVGRYAIRRLLRIYPAYAVGLALTALLAPLVAHIAATGFSQVTPSGFVANLLFAGDGFGNDGFRAVALFARAYLFFPALVLIWSRNPRIFVGLMLLLAIVDIGTPAHELSVGAYIPFMLGIIAADFRAQGHRLQHYGPVVLGAGAMLALLLDPLLHVMPGAHYAPHALWVDPFWSLAAFGLVVTAAAYRPVERACSFWMLRVIGASSYALSLIVVPTASLLAGSSPTYAIAIAVPVCFVVGFAYWQLVDRWFNDGDFRRNVAASAAAPLDELLAQARADRLFLGAEVDGGDSALDHQEEFVPDFYAPPPRPTVADLAIVSRRTGSPDELAAEILETKSRLQERSAEIFGEIATPPQVFAKPGFYRKQAAAANLPFEDVEDPFETAPTGQARPHEPAPVSQSTSASPQQPGGQAIRIRITGPGDGGFDG